MPHDSKDTHVTNQPARPDRRRLVGGVAGTVGVLMAVQAKTALGTTVCKSPSAMISGNTSPRPNQSTTCSGGRSPGFWKQPANFQYWSKPGATPPTFSVQVTTCVTGQQALTRAHISTKGKLVSSIFAGAPADTGIWEVLAFPNEFPEGQLLRHLIAAWLNAGYWSSAPAYPMSQAQVINIWTQLRSGGVYCPVGMSCGNKTWTPADVIAYISGMYSDTGVEPTLCKK